MYRPCSSSLAGKSSVGSETGCIGVDAHDSHIKQRCCYPVGLGPTDNRMSCSSIRKRLCRRTRARSDQHELCELLTFRVPEISVSISIPCIFKPRQQPISIIWCTVNLCRCFPQRKLVLRHPALGLQSPLRHLVRDLNSHHRGACHSLGVLSPLL